MIPNIFLPSFVLKIVSIGAAGLLGAGIVFLLALPGLFGIFLTIAGALLAAFALFAANAANAALNAELQSAAQFAERLAAGDVSADPAEFETDGLEASLREIERRMTETARLADRIGRGDLSADPDTQGDADRFGEALRNMVFRLRALVQTPDERERLRDAVSKLQQEVSDAAAGDLAVRADAAAETTGAIGGAFNRLTEELSLLIGQVRDVAFQINASTDAIGETTEQLARGSHAQASQLSRTSAAVSNMAHQIQEVSQNARLSAQVADESLNNARYGARAVLDNSNAMNGIRRQVQETAKRIKKLGERSQEIGQIVQLIGDLSDRTSLLALNASLQAAAAGEAGQGFAVVAEEVERLADRSNRLTSQIAALTETIQTETKDVVASMEETIHEVVVGSTLADKAGRALVEIEQVSGRLANLIGSISESAARQAETSEDISKAMADISEVTEMVSASSKRAADSVKFLSELAGELRGAVAPFKLPHNVQTRPQLSNKPRTGNLFVN